LVSGQTPFALRAGGTGFTGQAALPLRTGFAARDHLAQHLDLLLCFREARADLTKSRVHVLLDGANHLSSCFLNIDH
jgi:hypothetical protein